MLKGVKATNLDNEKMNAQSTVQVCRQVTTKNGCQVTMICPASSPENIRQEVADMLLAALTRKRRNDHEAGYVPVQGVDKRTN